MDNTAPFRTSEEVWRHFRIKHLEQHNERMRKALTEIAGCNAGEGYMPELARKALSWVASG